MLITSLAAFSHQPALFIATPFTKGSTCSQLCSYVCMCVCVFIGMCVSVHVHVMYVCVYTGPAQPVRFWPDQ